MTLSVNHNWANPLIVRQMAQLFVADAQAVRIQLADSRALFDPSEYAEIARRVLVSTAGFDFQSFRAFLAHSRTLSESLSVDPLRIRFESLLLDEAWRLVAHEWNAHWQSNDV